MIPSSLNLPTLTAPVGEKAEIARSISRVKKKEKYEVTMREDPNVTKRDLKKDFHGKVKIHLNCSSAMRETQYQKLLTLVKKHDNDRVKNQAKVVQAKQNVLALGKVLDEDGPFIARHRSTAELYTVNQGSFKPQDMPSRNLSPTLAGT